jgi:NitT/TauT family transport system ATP-binding protein
MAAIPAGQSTMPAAPPPAPGVQAEQLLTLRKISQSFPRPDGSRLDVLNNLDFHVGPKEIVGLLGRSGSGKSTLLRIVAGLARPTAGEVLFKGQPINGPDRRISMVFQSFALFPWLNVLENVELGLEAAGIPTIERRKRALKAIDMIGLDGFESAYPKELSGGMRQRVGFARALVVNPDLLLLDEPFSALDVLTAETLRTDFIELWADGKIPIKSVLIVTHGIEEAVLMCDRAVIFTPNPGRITAEIPITLPHPRSRQDPAFAALVEEIYVQLTKPPTATAGSVVQHVLTPTSLLPQATTNEMAGLLEQLSAEEYRGKADLPHLAGTLQLEVDELFPIAEALQILGFANLTEGDLVLTPEGEAFAEADTQARKIIFARQVQRHVPLLEHIKKVLDERPGHQAPITRFISELEDHLSDEAAERVMSTAVGWGRYAELFSYDDNRGTLSLDDPGS